MKIREIQRDELDELLGLYIHLHELGVPEQTEHLQRTWDEVCNDKNHHIIVCCRFVNDLLQIKKK